MMSHATHEFFSLGIFDIASSSESLLHATSAKVKAASVSVIIRSEIFDI